MSKKADQLPGWTSEASLEKHELRIKELLRRRGATNVALIFREKERKLGIMFSYDDQDYMVWRKPLDCHDKENWAYEYPNGYGNPAVKTSKPCPICGELGVATTPKRHEQALRQMGSLAYKFMEILLTEAFDGNNQELLLPYTRELTAGGPTLQEMGAAGFRQMLQDANSGLLAIGAGTPDDGIIDAEVIE